MHTLAALGVVHMEHRAVLQMDYMEHKAEIMETMELLTECGAV